MEEFIMDDPETDLVFRDIIRKLKPLQNGNTANSLIKRGFDYKINLGASIVALQKLASNYKRNHILALKLWNKQWRETMILATLLEEPDKVTGSRMDHWVKNFPTSEIAEQAVMNLFWRTAIAGKKAYEYCIGEKQLTKITGLLLIARLALTDRESPDEVFDPFFELMAPLSKDPGLCTVFPRVFTRIGMRNSNLREKTLRNAGFLLSFDSETARNNADEIIASLRV